MYSAVIHHLTIYHGTLPTKPVSRIMVHLSKARQDDGHFSTTEVKSADEPSLSTSRIVAFPRNPYKQPPNIAAGFRSLNISSEGPVRANLTANEIKKETFKIAIETWGNSTLYAAGATWIEHKAQARECIFGQFDTQDASPPNAQSATAPKASVTKQHVVHTDPVPQKYGQPCFFPKPFHEPPNVVVWLNRLDLGSGIERDYKIRASISEVEGQSFTAHLDTWDDGELNGAAMCWIAFPKRKRNVDSGSFSTHDVRKRTDPRAKTSARVNFQQRFGNVSTVLAALNMLDAAGNADLRDSVNISEVDREGFRWTLETWGDSTLYAAGASWIALGS